jgi:hypothetical protein
MKAFLAEKQPAKMEFFAEKYPLDNQFQTPPDRKPISKHPWTDTPWTKKCLP